MKIEDLIQATKEGVVITRSDSDIIEFRSSVTGKVSIMRPKHRYNGVIKHWQGEFTDEFGNKQIYYAKKYRDTPGIRRSLIHGSYNLVSKWCYTMVVD